MRFVRRTAPAIGPPGDTVRITVHDGLVIDERDAALLAALAEVRDALDDENGPEHDFYAATAKFLEFLHAQLVDRGYEPPALGVWDPRPALLDLEGRLAVDRSLDVDLAAACRTVREMLDEAAVEMATLN